MQTFTFTDVFIVWPCLTFSQDTPDTTLREAAALLLKSQGEREQENQHMGHVCYYILLHRDMFCGADSYPNT